MSNERSHEGHPSALTEEDRLSAMIVERDVEIARLKGVIEHLQGVIGGLHMEAARRDAMTVDAKFSETQREVVRDALSATLGDAMDCTRVWSAWGVGTMSENDFELVADNDERLDELVAAIESALIGRPAKQQGEGA
jgi:hypothetical protein